MRVYVYSVLATSFSDCLYPCGTGWHPAAPGSHSTILSSSHFSKFQKSPPMPSNLPHVAHMPILEPLSMANGMGSADWPGLGHLPHPSLPLGSQSWAKQCGLREAEQHPPPPVPKDSVVGSQKQKGDFLCLQELFSAM